MAEPLSIQQRIAALNLNQVGQPSPPTAPRRPPAPSVQMVRSRSTDNECVVPEGDGTSTASIGNQPAAAAAVPQPTELRPPQVPTRPEHRRAQSQAPNTPALPPRKPSHTSLTRRDSAESVSSAISFTSSISGLSTHTSVTAESRRASLEPKLAPTRSLAPTYDPASLPPLPPKRSEQARPSLTARCSSSSIRSLNQTREHSFTQRQPSPQPRALPPPVQRPADEQRRPSASAITTSPPEPPARPSLPPRTSTQTIAPPIPTRPPATNGGYEAATRPKQSTLSHVMNTTKPTVTATATLPQHPPAVIPQITTQPPPPPVPLSSRPNLAQLQASKPRISGFGKQAPPASCLVCRDFSAPDQHAAKFPRESIPSTDVAWISYQLTNKFPSQTDKARAIFTWLHHNIKYDSNSFFSGNIQPSNPASTIASGLAVCEGYAGLFAALAMHAGLESLVVGGHGKGFGHQPIAPGQPIPAFNSNHAWNAVKLDTGEWKLLDACWGAGYLDGNGQFNKRFEPSEFTSSNEEFGLKHFPKDQNMFFRADGRIVPWEEYFLGPDGAGEKVTVCTGAVSKHGIKESTIKPVKKHIQVRGTPPKQRIKFSFQKVCLHWDSERMGLGKPHVLVLNTGGKDGRKRGMVPFYTDGRSWWCEVPMEELGCAGQTLNVSAVTMCNHEDARGMKPEEIEKWVGRRAMKWEGVAQYQLI